MLFAPTVLGSGKNDHNVLGFETSGTTRHDAESAASAGIFNNYRQPLVHTSFLTVSSTFAPRTSLLATQSWPQRRTREMTFVTANSQLRIRAICVAWAEPRVTKVTFGRTAFTDTCPRTRNGGEVEDNMGRVSDKTVRDLASRNPSAARTFESFGIDYCCGGERSLAQACSAAKVSVEEVMRALEQTPAKGDDRDWQAASLTELVKHSIEKHHAYVRAEIPRLIALLAKVVRVHRLNHVELEKIEFSFLALAEELTLHLLKEERMLFPYIEQLEDAAKSGRRPVPAMFGTVRNPVRMMAMEHDSAGELLRKMREVTNGYTVPEDGCMSYRLLYRALPEFEADLHEHIHLENNILFLRAIVLEEETV